ncbi:PREDICTED: uncharacterized protein LOC104609038 [Nelumbo nucifera]|uniref:Uncharacterized protein LOC104609038 n=1 Tax=Nelumbo nucifera TaxID=4432 RepID=A0A1U8BAP9_NELNU|nr:PREDICTED: uncharacterized protein LOC104609038 [Nelumbo nucifera]
MQKQTIHTKDDQILAIVGRNSLSHCDGASSPSDRLPSSTLMEIVQKRIKEMLAHLSMPLPSTRFSFPTVLRPILFYFPKSSSRLLPSTTFRRHFTIFLVIGRNSLFSSVGHLRSTVACVVGGRLFSGAASMDSSAREGTLSLESMTDDLKPKVRE